MNEELLIFETSASKKREFPSEELDLNSSSNNNSLDSGIQDLNSSSLSSSSSSSTNQSHDLNISSANNAEFELDYNNEKQQHNQVLDNNNNKVTLSQQQHQQQSEYLSSVDHPHTLNNKSLFSYYFYTNTNTVLNRLVMSYEEQLHKAIVKANFELARELVEERRCDVNSAASKRLPLGLAAEYNILPIVQLLIKHGANLNQFDYYDQSALIYAVGSADLSLVKLLVKHGANVNLCNSNGTYPLHLAITRQSDEICEFLLQHGANVNGCDNNDYLKIVDELLRRGADPNTADNNGDTPLIKSIWLTMSSEVERDRIMDLVVKLVAAGADVNAKNETGRTALFTAIYQNNTDIALYLIESAGAKCELEDVLMSNFTLLHYACFQGNYTLVKALLDRRCDPNSIATSCESPVYIAVTKGFVDIVGLLIEYGADVNVSIGMQNDSKCTALQAALYYISDYTQFKCIVDKLIRGNANLNVSQPGPIIYICLQYNKINFAKYLVSVGASVELRTVFNQSCFYKAFLTKNLDFMEMCIMAGFNMYNEPWINTYLENPDFIEYTDYYVKKATHNKRAIEVNTSSSDSESSDESSNSTSSSSTNNNGQLNELMNKTDEEINDLLNMDEYYFERFHLTKSSRRGNATVNDQKRRNAELAKSIYNLIRYHYTNPLSLKELARIQVRKSLLDVDFRMKCNVEERLPLPKRLKDYLLLKEFNL